MRLAVAFVVGVVGLTSGHLEARWQQTVQPAVTNADVVSMTDARLSDEVIIEAVQQAAAIDFDVSPAALVALTSAGVSERVLQAMQARAKAPPRAGVTPGLAAGPRQAAESLSEPCRIFITEEEPASGSYVVVRKEVQAGKKFYGSHDDKLMTELATRADKAGADAIIKFHEWRAPSMWSWAAAKAGGMAVRWTAEGKAMVSSLKGQCWSPKGEKRD